MFEHTIHIKSLITAMVISVLHVVPAQRGGYHTDLECTLVNGVIDVLILFLDFRSHVNETG